MESSIQIEERAAAWLAKRDSDSWTRADELAFASWLDASTANRVAFLRLEAAWEAAERLQVFGAGAQPKEQRPFFSGAGDGGAGVADLDDVDSDDEPSQVPELRNPATLASPAPEHGERTAQPGSLEDRVGDPVTPLRARGEGGTRGSGRVRIQHPFRALAASVLVAAALGATYYLWPSGPSYRTEIGAVATVPMVDGSRITLNTDSEVRVAVSDTERHVELAQGEAFFDIAKDPSRPFVVEAGNQRYVAVGTKFSVRRNGDANRLVVTEGRVRVEDASTILAKAWLPPTEVSAGGVARSGEAGVLVEEKAVADAEVLLSWRSGYLVFKDTPLADAIAEFNRYNTRKIVVEDAAVAGILIGGNFRSTNVDAFVRLLEDGFPIHVQRNASGILLSDSRNVPAGMGAPGLAER